MRRGWAHFLTDIEPERPRLFRYCRKLTGSVWDAEDLVQSTFLKVFGSIALVDNESIRWGPYLARVASNHWIDQKRKVEPLALDAIAEPSIPPSAERAVAPRDGGRTLMTRRPGAVQAARRLGGVDSAIRRRLQCRRSRCDQGDHALNRYG